MPRYTLQRMAETLMSNERFDPYKNFNFRVSYGEQAIPEVRSVLALDDPSSETITLERGYTEDMALKHWIDSVFQLLTQPQESPDFSSITRQLRIEQLDSEGNATVVWNVANCRPAEYRPHPARLNQPTTDDSVEQMVLVHEGCVREA
jgi:phage tail-like protein